MWVRFVDVGGVRTRVLGAGDGTEPLVLLHGIGLTADTYLRNIDALATNGLVVAPDLLGHGFTAAPRFRAAPQIDMAEHVIALVRTLGHKRFTVGGSSYGGLVAALCALREPNMVRRLILIGSGSVFHPPEGRAASMRAAFENGRTVMGTPTLDRCRERLANICFDAASVPEELLLVQATAYSQADRLDAYRAAIDDAIATMDQADAHVTERLEDIACPVLTITGRDDIRSKVAHTEAGVARLRDGRLAVYDRCGHLPYLEHPARFNSDVAAFLAA